MAFATKPELSVKSVWDFVEKIDSLTKNGKYPTAFRGQAFYGWFIKPKLFRTNERLYENEHKAVRDIVSIHPAEFENDRTMFDRLVRMQHFGLATRLLDVTLNPLVALWFASAEFIPDKDSKQLEGPQAGKVTAFYVPDSRSRYYDSDRVSCIANIANLSYESKKTLFELANLSKSPDDFIKRSKNNATKSVASKDVLDELYYHIGMEKPHFRPLLDPKDILKPVYVKPKMANKRIIAQSGAFILFGTKDKVKTREEAIPSLSITIEQNAKKTIRTQLERLGIHESILFPEIEKAANFITQKYLTPQGVEKDLI